jgi:hypothetical protein
MKKNILIALCALVGLIGAGRLQAEQVDFGNIGSLVRLNNNVVVPAGSGTVWLGSFPTGFDFSVNTTFAQLSAAFTLYGTTVFGDVGSGGAAGQFFSTAGPTLPGVQGDRLYIWMFNSAVPANATQWAIVSNPAANWTRPVSGLNSTSIDGSDAGTFVPTGALGTINGANGDIIMGLVVIPEPSVMLLGALGLGLMAVQVRRSRIV